MAGHLGGGYLCKAQEIPAAAEELDWGSESSFIYNNSLEDMDCLKDEPIELVDNILWEAGEDQINDFVVGPTSIEVAEDDYIPPPPPEESTEGVGIFTKTRRVPFVYRAHSEFVIKTEAVDDSNMVMFCMICGDRAPYAGSHEFWTHVQHLHKMTPECYVQMYPDFRITEEVNADSYGELMYEDPVKLNVGSQAHPMVHYDAPKIEKRGEKRSRGEGNEYGKSVKPKPPGKERRSVTTSSLTMAGGIIKTNGNWKENLGEIDIKIKNNKNTQKGGNDSSPEPFYKGCEYRCKSCGEMRGSVEHIREHVRKSHKQLQHCDRANYDMTREEHFDCVLCGANMLRDYLVIKTHVRSRHKMGMVEYAKDYVNKK